MIVEVGNSWNEMQDGTYVGRPVNSFGKKGLGQCHTRVLLGHGMNVGQQISRTARAGRLFCSHTAAQNT